MSEPTDRTAPTRDVLGTARLRLRELAETDLAYLVELDSDPAVMRFLTGRPGDPARLAAETLPAMLNQRTGRLGYWVAELAADGAFIGWFALTASGDPASVELGYRLRRSAWGHGYATEGARALLERAFITPGVDRVFAQTMTVNQPSRRVLSRLGLRFVRTFFQDWPDELPGSAEGDVEYAISRTEWLAGRTDQRG